MTARQCDRCGGYYNLYGEINVEPNAIRLVTEVIDNDTKWIYEDHDLCPECMAKLKKFLENQEVSDET